MKISALASTPQLIPISIDDKEIVDKYGESIDFYIHDRQDVDTYMKLATIESQDFGEIARVMSSLVLEDDGSRALNDDQRLPMDITVKMVEKVIEKLGNFETPTTK
jgi:hypothetical protein